MAFALFACGSDSMTEIGQRSQPIASGTPNDSDTSAVFVVAKVGTGKGFCSGVVVSPHVVLTAAHCSSAAAEYRIFLGADHNDLVAQADPSNFVEVREYHPHPDWNRSQNTADIGVLITSEAIPRPSTRLNRQKLTGADVGRDVRIVGFGQTSGDSKAIGRRNGATTKLGAVSSSRLTIKGAQNICLFDSGGPSFMEQEGATVVAGIHFLIDSATCDSEGYDTPVEAYTAFVDDYIRMADPAPTQADAGVSEGGADGGTPKSAAPTASPGCSMAPAAAPAAYAPVLLALLFGARRRTRSRAARGRVPWPAWFDRVR